MDRRADTATPSARRVLREHRRPPGRAPARALPHGDGAVADVPRVRDGAEHLRGPRPARGVGPGVRRPARGYMAPVKAFLGWPVLRQVTGRDRLGRGHAAMSERSETLRPRTAEADRVVDSVCPYCAVGCAQKVFVKDGSVTQIEGNPASPISRGRLCPKGSASKQLVTSPTRVTKVRYRRPYATEWEDLDLDTAVDMIADRVIKTRKEYWEWESEGPNGRRR